MVRAEPDVCVRGQVKHQFAALDRACQRRRIEQVPTMQPERRRPASALQEHLLSRREVVVPDHLVTIRQQPVHQVTGHEAGGAGHKNLHFAESPPTRTCATSCSADPRLISRRIRNKSITFRAFPATNWRRLSPSSRQRIGTSLIPWPRFCAKAKISTSNMYPSIFCDAK